MEQDLTQLPVKLLSDHSTVRLFATKADTMLDIGCEDDLSKEYLHLTGTFN